MTTPFTRVVLSGCEAEAIADNAGGYTVTVYGKDEAGKKEQLLSIHVPPKEHLGHPQFWNSVSWGGLLLRKLFAQVLKKEGECKRLGKPYPSDRGAKSEPVKMVRRFLGR